ncbi:hypothetical protein [Streptomyces sp. NBC_01443]|uniref:hypothetical protein n=1 Tax=Streptomyces sp. NBC_01443 TaxID=2903868 RepID=UPI002259E620|nr:hypothetical protein [Streptomyces sp. NBC_01443]MCX4628749.1 hypothetical protein [Streptomyces sp. NBC_01443]
MRASRAAALAAIVLAGSTLLPIGTAAAASGPQVGVESTYFSVSNYRLVDTRVGNGAPSGKVGTDSVTKIDIANAFRLGSGAVPTAFVMNVTVVDPTVDSFVTAYPDGQAMPVVSSLNFTAGRTVTTNRVTVQVGANGVVDLYNHVGSAHLVVDLQGFYTAKGANGAYPGATFTIGTPKRLLDTRTAIGDRQGRVGAGEQNALAADAGPALPAGIVNLTSTNATEDGHITAHAAGTPAPNTSNLNYRTRTDVASMTIVPVSADGYIELYNPHGRTDLVVDVQGYYTS